MILLWQLYFPSSRAAFDPWFWYISFPRTRPFIFVYLPLGILHRLFVPSLAHPCQHKQPDRMQMKRSQRPPNLFSSPLQTPLTSHSPFLPPLYLNAYRKPSYLAAVSLSPCFCKSLVVHWRACVLLPCLTPFSFTSRFCCESSFLYVTFPARPPYARLFAHFSIRASAIRRRFVLIFSPCMGEHRRGSLSLVFEYLVAGDSFIVSLLFVFCFVLPFW